ncbi:MAG: methyltransferase [Microbacterium sp. SCN 70-27]|uniref:methyltransferase n=1 Tax=unclassified Microbacterium TaxID=2609290 RepID=UPI00086D9313|nr:MULTISPECIES: methyltransferase [unclassified Microbacterium]MBN9223430.1 methyltransferase [Microbacterium sp.]ODT28694.1 MAG: methyltransferase [Microbacterium sp. SCN 70-27]
MSTTSSALWVAYGAEGKVVGTIRHVDDGYIATIADADSSLGTYPTMEVAKSALHGHLPPGSDWPRFTQH